MKPVGRVFAILGVLMAAGPALADGCKLTRVAQFPIKMVGTRPLVTASINGVDVQFVVDSGAFYSMLSAGTATELKLTKRPLPAGLEVGGIHGATFVSVATAKTFTLPGFALQDVEFFVGGNVSGEARTFLATMTSSTTLAKA
jgi:Aspartyl protease